MSLAALPAGRRAGRGIAWRRYGLLLIGGFPVGCVLIAALFADWLTPYSPYELDVAVMVISNLRDRNALQAEIFETSPYRLWLPLGHKLAAAESIALSDIASEPLIMLSVDETEENTGKLLSALGAKPHVAFRTRSVEAVRSLVATGAGIALLPDLVYRPWSLEGDRIESRDISGTLPVVQVGMVWRRGSSLPQAARDFIGIAQAQVAARQRQ